MASYKTVLNTNARYLLVFACLLCCTLICTAFSLVGNNDFDLAKQELLLRKIGHEVLLHSGDSTSRVLPVKKITENEYQIRFENEFTFRPDSLVKIINRSLAKDQLAHNYIVNVLNCTDKEVIFGYAINKNEQDSIVACSGRVQPKACYLIDVRFQDEGFITSQKGYLLGGLPLLALVGFLITRSVKTHKEQTQEQLRLGNTLFDVQQRNLFFAGITTALTSKESRILFIFAQSPNAIIERARLQKEIWEDEGVIVGRSLDVFISKLRKKLEHDSTLQLTNIHGKGYKLEIN